MIEPKQRIRRLRLLLHLQGSNDGKGLSVSELARRLGWNHNTLYRKLRLFDESRGLEPGEETAILAAAGLEVDLDQVAGDGTTIIKVLRSKNIEVSREELAEAAGRDIAEGLITAGLLIETNGHIVAPRRNR